jgi:hypothetical protein
VAWRKRRFTCNRFSPHKTVPYLSFQKATCGPAARGALRRGERFVGARNVASCRPCAPNQASWLGAKSIVHFIPPNLTTRSNHGASVQRKKSSPSPCRFSPAFCAPQDGTVSRQMRSGSSRSIGSACLSSSAGRVLGTWSQATLSHATWSHPTLSHATVVPSYGVFIRRLP